MKFQIQHIQGCHPLLNVYLVAFQRISNPIGVTSVLEVVLELYATQILVLREFGASGYRPSMTREAVFSRPLVNWLSQELPNDILFTNTRGSSAIKEVLGRVL